MVKFGFDSSGLSWRLSDRLFSSLSRDKLCYGNNFIGVGGSGGMIIITQRCLYSFLTSPGTTVLSRISL